MQGALLKLHSLVDCGTTCAKSGGDRGFFWVQRQIHPSACISFNLWLQPTSCSARSPACHSRKRHRGLKSTAAAGSNGKVHAEGKPCKGGPLLERFISLVIEKYWASTPTAVQCMGLMQALDKAESSPLYFDHLAFRTFGVAGFGIKSIATIFQEFGYQQRDELQFSAKKLRALWFSPPKDQPDLPRIFISELKVEELSQAAQDVIQRYCDEAGSGKYAPLCAVGSTLPWSTPSLADFELLAEESEYAAWTLVNGYALNHTTVAVHRMRGMSGGIAQLVEDLKKAGFELNEEGGTLKVSPDGLLVQAATQADQVDFAFRDGEQGTVPGSYLEMAQRHRLPQFDDLDATLVSEEHLRDGFEASNADKIFNSTTRRPQPVH